VPAPAPTLKPGDPAPKLSISKWVKGDAVPAFEKGKVYIVEFWATWCGPCIKGIPHLTELQARYAGRVDVIGVDVWESDLAKVEPFVTGLGERMAYTVAVDDVPAAPADCENVSLWSADNGKTSVAWMVASGWNKAGIPAAFVVDGKGRIAWIGAPLELDALLAAIVAGNWDLARESATYRARMETRVKALPIHERLNAAQKKRDFRAVVASIDELLALDPAEFASYAGGKFQTLLLDCGQTTASRGTVLGGNSIIEACCASSCS
jgi:thiol-disulfide isomerase/thioredoxin